ncbi:MAG: helix-turn-helix transcriptional regulator [Acetatifactor sp.]|nr:helix-turn-helix transcriptional regulator [Acetatifactor sp.]
MELAARLKQLRKLSGISQAVLAEYLMCSSGTISNYENGVHSPDPETLISFANFYGVSVDYLLGRTQRNQKLIGLDQYIFGLFTVSDLLWLGENLSEEHLMNLVHLLKLFIMVARFENPTT